MKNRFIILSVMCSLLLCASPQIAKTTENSEMVSGTGFQLELQMTAGANRHMSTAVVVQPEQETVEQEPTIQEEIVSTVQQSEKVSVVKQTEDGKPDPYEVYLMAHLIYGEAGDQEDDCQLAVGAVVLNRVKHEKYPDTIEEVIFQKRQYACTWDGNFDKEPSQQAWDNAYWLLENELSENPIEVIPLNVIYQAQSEQGSGKYDIIGSETFCYE